LNLISWFVKSRHIITHVGRPCQITDNNSIHSWEFSGFRGRRQKARSVFDGFRDFQAEASKYVESFKYTGPLLLWSILFK
jgi:hypothetical protein